MDVYNYVAESDPNGAAEIIRSFGYDIVVKTDLGRSLKELVAEVGEPALKKIMAAHPDKDVILELFSEPIKMKKGDTCKSCIVRKAQMDYMNASGSEATKTVPQKDGNSSTLLANQTNVILIVASLFIATALIINKKQ